MLFTLTDRTSIIPSNIHTYMVANPVRGLLDRRRSEEHLQSTNKRMKKKRGTITQSTCQKKIEEMHSIERVWYSASREPSDTLAGSQPCTQTHSILSGFQVSLLEQQPTSLRESLGWSNQRGSKTSQACYSHPRCNLNLVRLFRLSLPLPVFGRLFIFLRPRGRKPTAPFTYCTIPDPRVKCGGAPVPRHAKHPKIICLAVRPLFLLPPRLTFSRVLQPS